MKSFLGVLGGLALLLVVFIVILGLSYVGAYNSLNHGNQEVQGKFGDVQSDLQRRNDLVPGLVETVKGVARFERSTFTEVAQARAQVGQIKLDPKNATPAQIQEFLKAQDVMSGALSRLMVVVEKYPDLKANQNFLDLQSQLEGTENRINVSRKRYNKAVEDYNTLVGSFFTGFVANMGGFRKAEYYQASEKEQEAPTVKFD